MAKLLLLSIIIMMVVIPVKASKALSARVGAKRALGGFLAYCVFYWLAVVYVYFFLLVGRDPTALLTQSVHD